MLLGKEDVSVTVHTDYLLPARTGAVDPNLPDYLQPAEAAPTTAPKKRKPLFPALERLTDAFTTVNEARVTIKAATESPEQKELRLALQATADTMPQTLAPLVWDESRKIKEALTPDFLAGWDLLRAQSAAKKAAKAARAVDGSAAITFPARRKSKWFVPLIIATAVAGVGGVYYFTRKAR